jgi:hypothetical protein
MSGEVAFYSPDTDPTVPGTLTDVSSLVPSLKGYKGAPSGVSGTLPALADTAQGAATLLKLNNTSRFIAGTGTKLYEAASTVWTDVSRAAPYGLAGDARWSFAQFGDTSLAANKADLLQFSNSGAFADVPLSPQAAIVETVNNFVFLGNTSEAIYGDSPDRVIWGALGSYTDFVASITTQAGTVRITSRPGKITALKRFGNALIVYKSTSMFIATYQGAPNLWDFQDIPGEIGTPCNNTVVNVGTPEDPRHLFMGTDDFYQFDGARPIPIGSPLKETVFNDVNQTYIDASYVLHDRLNSRVYFYYPAGGSTVPNKCVVYHYKANRWGRDDQTIECASEYITPALTYGDLGSLYSLYGDLPDVSYASAIFASNSPAPAIFGTDHVLYTLNGASEQSSLTTGDYGNETTFMLLRRVKPQFITAPTTATMTNYYRDSLGAPLTTDTITNLDSRYRFDVLRSARWHRVTMVFNGDVELNSFVPDGVEAGSE